MLFRSLPKQLAGLGILPHGMLNLEDEVNGKVMVRNGLEEMQAWNRWFVEFMDEEDDNERLEEQNIAEQYLGLSKRGGSRGTMELLRMV